MSGCANITLPNNTDAQWAWLAGILDGEGSFYVNAKRGYAAICIGMKDEDVIRRVADTMGCKRIWRAQKGIWRCAAQGKRAVLVMDRIYSWMSIRRKAKIDSVREAIRALPGHVHGERSPLARLKANDVRQIRALAQEGVLQARLAERFGLTQPGISAIVLRKTWARLDARKEQEDGTTRNPVAA